MYIFEMNRQRILQNTTAVATCLIGILWVGCSSKNAEKPAVKQEATVPALTNTPPINVNTTPPTTTATNTIPSVATPDSMMNQDPSNPAFSVSSPAITTTPIAPNESVKSLQDKLVKNPKDTNLRIQLAALIDMQGDTGFAEDVLRVALQQGQKVPEIYHALGMLYLRSSNSGKGGRQELLKGAVEEFKYELKLDPKSFEGHLNMGRAYTELGNASLALQAYETAVKIKPEVADTYLGLAYLNNSSERYPYGVKYLQEFIKRASQKGPGYVLLSRLYLNMREYSKAIEAGKLATQTMPSSGSSWYILGQAYSYQPTKQDWVSAVDAYQHVIKLIPTWANAYFELGRSLEKLNKREEAVTQYRSAIRYEPIKGRYQYQLGHLLMTMGQVEEGKKIVTESQKFIKLNAQEEIWTTKIATNPKDPENYYQLGLVFIQYGDYSKAKQCLEAVLSANPKYKDARAQWTKIQSLAGTTK